MGDEVAHDAVERHESLQLAVTVVHWARAAYES